MPARDLNDAIDMPRNEGRGERIIDAHVHLSGRRDDELNRFAKMNNLRYTFEELLSIMRRSGVKRGLLLSPPLQGGKPLPNAEIIRLCSNSGGKLAPVITAEPAPRDVREAITLAKEREGEIKAFKIRLGYVDASANSPVFGKLYDYAESRKLPILFHTGDTASRTGDLASAHPLTLDRLANEREKLNIVLCHFGNPWFEDVAELIYKHPNVHADTSGLITGGRPYAEKYVEWLARKIDEAIYYAGGADKILFGTDYPVTEPSDALDLIRMLDVSEDDKEKILWRNAERLFSL